MVVSRSNFLDAVARFSRLSEKGTDTETTGLSEDDSLFSVILADEEGPCYFNFNTIPDHLGNWPPAEFILPRSWIVKLQPVFEAGHIHYIQNAKFDMRMLAKEGIVFNCEIRCTEALGRVRKNNHIKYNLDVQVKRELGLEKDDRAKSYIDKNGLYTPRPQGWGKEPIKQPRFDQLPFDIVSTYGGTDGVLHRALGQNHWVALSADPGLLQVAQNEVRLTKTCFRMERVGIRLDRAYTEKAWHHERAIVEGLRLRFQEATGHPYLDSGKLFATIFDAAGVAYGRTEKGNPSFDDDNLEKMNHPVAKIIQEVRHYEKRLSTYYAAFLTKVSQAGRIHADIRQAGTETGRFSYRDPNLQNVPKEDEPEDLEKPFQVRGCFIASDDFFLVPIDYKQQEYRMMLDYAGEKKLIRAIMGGADVHQATADLVGITRKLAKTLNFAVLYGSGADKMAAMLGISVSEARRLKAHYFANLPYVERFIFQVRSVGRSRGYVRNWYGRHCHIARPDWAYILPNHLIQGGCADVVKIAMNRCDDFLLEKKARSRMILQVHDEILFEVHKNEIDLVPELQKIMEDVYPGRNGMRLEGSVEWSAKSWSAKDKRKGLPNEIELQAPA